MAKSISLSDAIEEFLKMRAMARRGSTVTQDRCTMGKLLKEVGNIQSKHLTAQHAEKMLAYFSKTQQANSIAAEFARLRVFEKWLKARTYLAATETPFKIDLPRPIKRPKARIPESDFPALLDAADKPRDRLVVALGLYLFLRQSEMRYLRVYDVDMDANQVMVTIIKTEHEPDEMPMCKELKVELARWFRWYHANSPIPVRPDHYLVPAMTPMRFVNQKGHVGAVGSVQHLVPTRPVGKPEGIIQKVMQATGLATRDASGKSLSEGVHTLRRSGARALFDSLLADGYDGALRTVQAMLHHRHASQTEGYLGIDVDKKRRNDLLKGRSMYRSTEDAQVLRLVAGEGR